jgi:dynein heavy chain
LIDTVYRRAISTFCDASDCRHLFFHYPDAASTTIVVSLTVPSVFPKKGFFILKTSKVKITADNVTNVCVLGDIDQQPLQSLDMIARDILLPVMNDSSRDDKVRSFFGKFLSNMYVTIGQTEGKTLLPLPLDIATDDSSTDSATTSSDDSDSDATNEKLDERNKDRIHTLETAIITWNNQIKDVLKNDPENLFKLINNPGPLDEVAFWKSKCANLVSIRNQLQSPQIQTVLSSLRNTNSTYIQNFEKLIKEVDDAIHESEQSYKYLQPLIPYFKQIQWESTTRCEWAELDSVFRGLFHLVWLVWKNCEVYRQPKRLISLIREVCNNLIDHARLYVGGKELFSAEIVEPIAKLTSVLSLCALFKKYYFAYKQYTREHLPSHPWRIQPNALFHRLDSFLERIRDCLEVCELVQLFDRLAGIEIGGTKGEGLSREIRSIHKEFMKEFQRFKEIEYDALDVDIKDFDETFYQFKSVTKECERKIGAILSKAFEDCNTIFSAFKLIESFHPLLQREIIQQELEKKSNDLVVKYKKDLKVVQQLFQEEKDDPPLYSNMPPTAGALIWCQGLVDRIDEPMAKLTQLNEGAFKTLEGREAIKLHDSIIENIRKFQLVKYNDWAREIGSISTEKLNQFLLGRSTSDGLLYVNFDSALVRLLREVNYIEKLQGGNNPDLVVPKEALDIFDRAEVFRTQTGSLKLIVNMYNNMHQSLLDVEKPLLQAQLELIDQKLERGISQLNWNSPDIDDFVAESTELVKKANNILTTLKACVEEIQRQLSKWERSPMYVRKETRTLTLQEFKGRYSEMKNLCIKTISKGGETLHKELQKSFGALNGEIDETSEAWINYRAYTNSIVIDGFVKAVLASMISLREQLDEAHLVKAELSPFLEVSLKLENESNAIFRPHLEMKHSATDSATEATFGQILDSWFDDFLSICNHVTRLDGKSGGYLEDVKGNKEIDDIKKLIRQLVTDGIAKANKFRTQYTRFAYLWENNRHTSFEKFLKENGDDNLENFDKQIQRYKEVIDSISELPNYENVSWMRVDSRPMKQELTRLADAWKSLFTGYLANKVTSNLDDLYGFMNTASVGLQKEVEQGDVETLKEVIGYIRDVRSKVDNSNEKGMFAPLKSISELLAKHDAALKHSTLSQLEEAPVLWDQLHKESLNKRAKLSVLQDEEAKKMKDNILDFNDKLIKFQHDFNQMGAFFWETGVKSAYKELDKWHILLYNLEEEAKNLRKLQQLFELTVMEYKSIDNMRLNMTLLKTLWDMASHVLSLFKDWMKTSFKRVDVDFLVEETRKLKKQIAQFNSKTKSWDSYNGLSDTVNNMLVSLPLVQDLRNPAMRPRHWEQLLEETHKAGVVDPQDESFSLEQLLELGLHAYVDNVQTIVDKASKQLIIENNLTKIEGIWKDMAFVFEEHDKYNCTIVGTVEEVIENLEDNLVALQNMSTVRYVEYFFDRLNNWQNTLSTVESVITLWTQVQKTWSNLYPIFVLSEDIRTQLQDDAKRFESVDKKWREMMEVAKHIPNVVEACARDTIKQKLNSDVNVDELLKSMLEDLERCEKSLADYLETKRRAFPRFYFVSPADLVDILSKGSFPRQVMKHMAKIIDGVQTLTFEEGKDVATEIISNTAGEVVVFSKPYECKGAVEAWLHGLLENIKDTLATILSEAHASYLEQARDSWIFNFPAQLVVVAARIWFTSEVNSAFDRQEEGDKNALKDYNKLQVEQLYKLTQLVQGKLLKGDRKKIITLITVDVHNRDIVIKLMDEKAENAQVFTWQSQLRYVWDEKKGCVINIADAEFTYNYEYVGNCGCLVITPLTDRCYITLSQSLRLVMGGAPAGPAGTGKTETTKDLGRALGTAVYVFNCTDQMDYMSLGDIFKGLAMTGTWGCFDEFNRVRIGVLSVVATQFKSILDAIRAQKKEFNFQNSIIPLIPTCGVFITMNPGYKGRTELPENLKALFRPCAMIVPDLMNICEIMLASEGFIEAKPLAKKFVTLYKLNRELLSKQDHYDWGLRAIKSVLVIAGGLKRAEPTISEEKVLMRALRDTNMAKLSRDDIEIFKRLISDLFPNLEVNVKRDMGLEDALKKAAQALNYQPGENNIFITKGVQFKELLDVRHSVFILGPAGSAKSSVWKTLSKALEILDKKVWLHIMDPKAVSSDELYGYMHRATRDWKDGILSYYMREMSRSENVPASSPKWIILDGDIDAEWIESMNTVMDDNKVLTLASNERIPLTPAMRMIFEISHLKNATPATVSRAGILFLNETDVGWGPFKESWIETRTNEREKHYLEQLFEKYTHPILEWLKKNVKHVIPVCDINMIQTLCYVLEGLLTEETCPPGTANEVYENYFTFSCIYAFGGALDQEDRVMFSGWFKKTFAAVKFPEAASVFDFFISEGKNLTPWSEILPKYVHDYEKPFNEIVVHTEDTVRLTYLTNLMADNRRPVLFVGTAGTGKTTIVKEKLNNLNENIVYSAINFNSNTDSQTLQIILEQSLDKKAGRRFAPPGIKKLIYFVDDLNMPNPDKYGTQSAIALMRQHMDYGFWFDRAKMTTKEIANTQYIAAMNPKAGSFTVDDRLQRHFGIFACSFPSRTDLQTIYHQMLKGHFQHFSHSVSDLSMKLVEATIVLHKRTTEQFMPTAIKFHYQFNLRELSNIFQGLCLSTGNKFSEADHIIRLWLHENLRVFADRMMAEEDIDNFSTLLKNVAKEQLGFDAEKLDLQTLLFNSFMETSDTSERLYTEATDFDQLKAFLNKKLDEYNSDRAGMNLELFTQAIQHICRISRIIANPRGNALLVGVGGSGKQSLSRLASFINGYETAQITVTAAYSIIDFKNTLITLYKNTGLKGQDLTFILTDSQIIHEKMLVFINDLLSSGYIPELFANDEKEQIIGSIQSEVKLAGKDHNDKKVCWNHFIEKVRNKLHIVLCFSPIGEQFRVWCRKFPAIINCTAIDWFHAWPRDALISVAMRFLKDINFGSALDNLEELIDAPDMKKVEQIFAETDATKDLRLQVAEHSAFVHKTVTEASKDYAQVERRYNYTTPKSYLEFLELYKQLLSDKRWDLIEKIGRLSRGLRKLRESSTNVAQLQELLKDEQVLVEEKQAATEELVKRVTKDRAIVEEQSKVARGETEKTNKLVAEVEEFEKQCRDDLEKAQPLVDDAIAALSGLDKQDLGVMKSFNTPKEEILDIGAAVMILTADPKKGPPKNVVWPDVKKRMQNVTGFINELMSFDRENIPPQNIIAIKPYIAKERFNKEAVMSLSSAAAGLCSWVVNMVKFHEIFCEVEPKRKLAEQAGEKLAASRANLKRIQDKERDLKKKLNALLAEYDAAEEEKRKNEERAAMTQQKLNLAKRLIGGLADENVRWAQSIEDLKLRETTLIGDVLLAAAFLSYVGPFNKLYRTNLLEEKWLPDLKTRKVPTTENIDPLFNVLTDEAQVAQWNNEGLPSDRTSIENGAIVTNCKRWPLLIDPQLQGVKWIKNRESKNNLQIIQLNQRKYLDRIEQAIIYGNPVLIENIGETIDSILEPLLSRSFIQRGKATYIQLGEKEVEYSLNFKLYLQTKLSNPHYRPEIVAQTTLLNFVVTEAGLEDQLLAVVVNKERPDLEQQRVMYLRRMRQFKIELKACEDALLYELTNAKGDILENKNLIENLELTKEKSKEISKSVAETTENNKKIDASRKVYTSVAIRGSLLYFLMDKLCNIDHMYQYSLEAFMVVFNKALGKALEADTVEKRVANITECITETLFSYVSRGLFERHKLIFSTMLCFDILKKQNDIDLQQLNFLLKPDKTKIRERPENVIGWCSEMGYNLVQALTEIQGTTPAFSTLPDDMNGSWRRWKEWCEFEKPEEKPLPLEWKNLTTFQKLLVIRCLRPDRLTMAVSKFVEEKIGAKYVQAVQADTATTYQDAGPTTPIFFILSPGVDPLKGVEKLGNELGYTEANDKFKNVSLGEGQEIIAEKALEHAFREGGWVMLNNLHLTPEWLVALEKKLDTYAEIFSRQKIKESKIVTKAVVTSTTENNEENAEDAENNEDKDTESVGDQDDDLVNDNSPTEDQDDVQLLDDQEEQEDNEQKKESDEENKESDPDADKTADNEDKPEKEASTENVQPATEETTTTTEIVVEEEEEEDETDGEKGNPDFRVFLSAEPSQKIPLGILQRSIKLTNEPPSGLRPNLFKAFSQFDESVWEGSAKQTEFKGILFSLSYFHSVIVERKKFGPQGWNRNYPFNLGDLTTCIAVLNNYLEDRPKVPWDDLRYVFGEIMYGGHITDDWDRRVCMTYLGEYIREEVVESIELCPGLMSPPTSFTYKQYLEFIENNLPAESPTSYGLHPNAEIGFRTSQGENLFNMILDMQPQTVAGGDGLTIEDVVRNRITGILDILPELYNLDDIAERLDEERTPFQNCFYQECEYMNTLLATLDRTLRELRRGLDGELAISDKMQELMNALATNRVPDSWRSVAYPSLKPLDLWVQDLTQRNTQLQSWTQDLQTPKVVWVCGLFNPQSFLTAIMQSTARRMAWPLDKMTLSAEVTKKYTADEIDAPARDGAYITGLYLEGATWDAKKNSLVESKLKELYPKMPIMLIKAVQIDKSDTKTFYDCPVYKTQERGPDYIFSCKLKTAKLPPTKWILGGVALLGEVLM